MTLRPEVIRPTTARRRHVIPEQATVYRCVATNRRYLSKAAAYYNAAKSLVADKYPNGDKVVDYEQDTGSIVCRRDIDPDRDWERIDRRRDELFRSAELDGAFDSGKWSRFVRRVAKFLRFADSTGVAIGVALSWLVGGWL